MTSRRSLLVRSLVSTTLLALAAGCAGSADTTDVEPTTEDLSARPHVARVTANGTGCPAGTTEAHLSADGASVTVDFSAFAANIEDGNAIAVADCTLLVGVDGSRGYQYTLDSFEADGEAEVFGDPDDARQTLAYGFMGSGPSHGEQAIDLTTLDREDGTYSFHGRNDASQATWSPCTTSRDLEVLTRLVLSNNENHGAEVSVNQSHLKLSLRYRRCG